MAKRKSPAKDPQREEAYSWEDKFYACHYNTADPAWFKKHARKMCEAYEVPIPQIVIGMPRKWRAKDRITAAVCDYRNRKLYFSKGWASVPSLCHEMAHWVCDAYGYGDVGAHGPKWLGVYLWMLGQAEVLPLDAAKYSARKAGLKFRDPERECAPGQLKKYLKKNT